MHFIDLETQQKRIRNKIDKRIEAVFAHGQYIMGPEVRELEDKLSCFTGAQYSLTCANGTDALQIALMALGIGAGDAVLVPAFTFASSAEVVPQLGAVPVFVDVDPITFTMDPESLKRAIVHTKTLGLRPAVVMPVDLFGLPADYDALVPIAREEGMFVIADSAQAFGAIYKGRKTGTLADITTTSFFPAKPLGCYGDGGCLFTNNEEWSTLIDSYRVHGKGADKNDNVRVGLNSRLDTLQAAVLLEKLNILEDEIQKRNIVASRYSDLLDGILRAPSVPDDVRSVWAQYCLLAKDSFHREMLMNILKSSNIPSMIYYPKPLTQQVAYKDFPKDPDGCISSVDVATRIFSIPMHPYMDFSNQKMISEVLKDGISTL